MATGIFENLIATEWEPRSARSNPVLREQLFARAKSLPGGVAFMAGERLPSTPRDLLAWLDAHVVEPGWMRMPRNIREPGLPLIELDARAGLARSVQVLTSKACARVGAALIGFLAPVPDERFLHAAIHGGRVRRGHVERQPLWLPSPRETDFLSDIVLSLFAADLLQNPDLFRPHMCVCPSCSRVTFTSERQAFGRRCMQCSGASRSAQLV